MEKEEIVYDYFTKENETVTVVKDGVEKAYDVSEVVLRPQNISRRIKINKPVIVENE